LQLDHVNVGNRVAATDACVQRGSIGTGLSSNASRVDLAIAQTLSAKQIKVTHGKATYGKSIDQSGSSAFGGFVKAPYSLSADLTKILDFSKACGSAKPNTTVKKTCRPIESFSPQICTIRITGTSREVNIAELSAAQIANVSTFLVDLPAGGALVTNLPENRIAVFRGVAVDFENAAAGPIFWNFPSADNLEFSGTQFQGTVIAPDGAAKVCDQQGDAAFWVHDFNGTTSNLY
jgi:choice-of-anchor A domain-containing protein